MNEIVFVVEKTPEGGFSAKALGESIFTEADTVEELHASVRDAVRCHFEEGKIPKMIRLVDTTEQKQQRERAMSAAGRFNSGIHDLAEKHDDCLAEAFDK